MKIPFGRVWRRPERLLRPSQVLHQGIAGSQLVIIPGAGHTSMAEAPEAVNQAIRDFLQRLEGGR